MIVNDLYSYELTYLHHYGHSGSDDILTGQANSTHNDGAAYYLGYVNAKNLPITTKYCITKYDSDTDSFVMQTITQDDDFPCGYIEQGDQFYRQSGTASGITGCKFCNKLFPEYSCFIPVNVTLRLYGCVLPPIASGSSAPVYPTSGSDFAYIGAITLSTQQFYDLVKNGTMTPATFTTTNYNITINASDLLNVLDDNGDNTPLTFTVIDNNNDNQVVLCIRGITFGNGTVINYKNNSNQIASQYIMFFAKTKLKWTVGTTEYSADQYVYTRPFDSSYYLNGSSLYSAVLEIRGQNIRDIFANKLIPFGCHSVVKKSDMTSNKFFIAAGNALWVNSSYSGGSGSWQVYPMFSLMDGFREMALQYRVSFASATSGYTDSYTNGVTYATDVADDGEFLADIKTGNITDSAFRDTLQIWQYTNTQYNDFTEEDIPTPAPGPGPRPEPVPPGDGETDGDDVNMNDPTGIGNGFGFTTMYGIRASHLSEIGAKLWSGFSDVTDYINNFVFAVDPTSGSVNLSDIMQFFISLRAYPCPLSAMASTSAGGTDMYIGSGAAPLSLTTPFSIVDSYIGHIDAGSVDIPFWYGDYRDYALEIICYLPYCGTVQLNAGDVIGGTLSAYYTVDFCSGACMAYVLCTTWEGKIILVGSLPGQLGADIPMTATNAGQVMARMYGDRINVAENLLGAAKNGATGIGAIMSGNIAGAIRSGISAFIDPAIANERQLAEMGSRSAIAAPMLSGGRGLAAFGTSKTAYVQIRSPYYTEPANYEHAVGTPAASAVRIGDCAGFCQFVNVDVSGITADADDQNAIRAALESGVIL